MPRALAPIAVPNGKPSKALAKLQIKVERVQSLDTVFQVFNMDDPVLGGYTPERVALRRALALAMDTASIIRQVYKGQAQIAQTPMTPMTYGYDPTAVTEMGQTDPARANAMLDIYGYQARDEDGFRVQPNGQRLELTYASQPEQIYRVTEEVVKRSFNSIGIRVRFSTAQWAEQLRTARSGQFQIWALGASAAGPDGASIFSYGYGPEIGGQNLSRFSNKLFDELWDKQDAMPDSPERLAIIKEMNDILMAYMPMNFLANRFTIGMTYPWVKYYRRWPFVDTDFLRYVDIDVDMKRKAGH
jgi:ABC-type transport system substrate-binding protein